MFITGNASSLVNSLGLIFDIIGAILLWRFGLPEQINRAGTSRLLLPGVDKAEIQKAKWYDHMAKWGLSLLILGGAS